MGFALAGLGLILLIGAALAGRGRSGGGGLVTRTPNGPDGLPDLARSPDEAAAQPLPPQPGAAVRASREHVERQVQAVLTQATRETGPSATLTPAAVSRPAPAQATLTPMGPPIAHPAPPSPAGTPMPGQVDSASPGYNTDTAHRLAGPLAQHIASRRGRYDHGKVRAFQSAAGIPADGVYGSNTRIALAHYGVRNPPPAVRT